MISFMNENSIKFLNKANAPEFAKLTHLNATPLERQLLTAHLILRNLFCRRGTSVQGMLLADEVGLGKTTIGAIVAWVAASATTKSISGRTVRILAPNPHVREIWEKELNRVVPALTALAGHLRIDARKQLSAKKLCARHIFLTTRGRAILQNRANADLIIVDEAHRSKHERSKFRRLIKSAAQSGSKLLFLTATPMSLGPEEMASLLKLIGNQTVSDAVKKYGEEITSVYDPADMRGDDDARDALITAANHATEEMRRCTIRHTVDNLRDIEQSSFGNGSKPWNIAVPPASPSELELLARVDRVLRIAYPFGTRSNDPQFHVARAPIRKALEDARARMNKQKDQRSTHAAKPHFKEIENAGLLETDHPKMVAVANAVAERVKNGEKIVIFCHHLLVAAELTWVLSRIIPTYPKSDIDGSVWENVWREIIQKDNLKNPPKKDLVGIHDSFIKWICTPSFQSQIGSWLKGRPLLKEGRLRKLILESNAPRGVGNETVAESMQSLYQEVADIRAKSSVAIFRCLARGSPQVPLDSLPFGSPKLTRVLGVFDTPKRSYTERYPWDDDAHLFLHEKRPELLMSLFNSPFGPDVLVLTDKYSEGIDLHKACRLLVHYELDPSPMRTVQREGRIRRIGGWAGQEQLPVEYAMPAFRGTRDGRVVSIMTERIDAFRLLLGGVPECTEADLGDDSEARPQRILASAKTVLQKYNKRLCVPLRC